MRHSVLAWLGFWVASMVGPLYAAPSTAPAVDLKDVIRTVIETQGRVTSLQADFVQRRFYPKDSLTVMDRSTRVPRPVGQPKEDKTVEARVRVCMDKGRMRIDLDTSLWNATTGGFHSAQLSEVIEKGAVRYYSRTHKRALVSKDGFLGGLTEFYPIKVAYRLFDPVGGGAEVDKVKFVGFGDVGGHACIVIGQADDHGFQRRWWLSREQDMSVVQYRSLRPDGTVLTQATMDYALDKENRWVLRSWQTAVMRDNKILDSSACSVTEIRLNAPLPEDAFDLVFSHGSHVQDDIAGVRYVVGEESKDLKGLEHLQAAVESVPTDREAIAAEAPSPEPDREGQPAVAVVRKDSGWWLFACGGIIVGLIAALLVWRKTRSSGASAAGR